MRSAAATCASQGPRVNAVAPGMTETPMTAGMLKMPAMREGAERRYISRAAWGADETFRFDAADNEYWPLEYQTVEHVIIHHTETVSFQNPLAAIRAIYYYHAVERGWGDIGYNYLVDHMGNVYEGRYGGEDVVGGHAYEYAYGSSGIGVLGSFKESETTPEAQAGVVWITAWTGRKPRSIWHLLIFTKSMTVPQSVPTAM